MNSNQTTNHKIIELLGSDAVYLLDHVSRTIAKEQLLHPNDRIMWMRSLLAAIEITRFTQPLNAV